MKLEVGMYVRTSVGIGKIINFDGDLINFDGDLINIDLGYRTTIDFKSELFDIKKSSFNIIDLIEVGDLVNGFEIVRIDNDPFIKNQINLWTNYDNYDSVFQTFSLKKILAQDIKEILTHEQYEANCYKVVE